MVAHAVTGTDGRFRLDGLAFDRYLLRASLLGYASFVRRDVVLTEHTPDLDLGTNALAVSPIAIPGAEVSTARATTILAPDRNTYLTQDLPAAASGTTTDILRAVPELDVDIDGHVSLRGSTSVGIQFNGRAAPLMGEARTTFLRQMPASRIERVEVIANPSAKFEPEGTAGIVNLVLKDNVGLGLSGSVNVTAGQRYGNSGARVAWQRGPVTCFGGLAGTLLHYAYESSTERRSSPDIAGRSGAPRIRASSASSRAASRTSRRSASPAITRTARCSIRATSPWGPRSAGCRCRAVRVRKSPARPSTCVRPDVASPTTTGASSPARTWPGTSAVAAALG